MSIITDEMVERVRNIVQWSPTDDALATIRESLEAVADDILEQCAQEAERWDTCEQSEYGEGFGAACRGIARAIRSAKSKP